MGRRRGGGALSFRQNVLLPIVKTLTNWIEGKGLYTKKDVREVSLAVINTARVATRKARGRKYIRVPSIIPFAKKGRLLLVI